MDVATQWPWKCHFQGPRFLFSRFWALDSSLLLWSFLAFPLVRSVCFVFSVCKRCHRTVFDVLLYFWTNFLTWSSVFSLMSNSLTCLIVATCALHPPFSFPDFFYAFCCHFEFLIFGIYITFWTLQQLRVFFSHLSSWLVYRHIAYATHQWTPHSQC